MNGFLSLVKNEEASHYSTDNFTISED